MLGGSPEASTVAPLTQTARVLTCPESLACCEVAA
jgi:hypothetical protein